MFVCIIFVGSRACAANHYAIAEKCNGVCPIFGERRFSEQVPMRRSLSLSERCRNARGC